MNTWIMVISILLKEVLGRIMRLSGQIQLMGKTCSGCDFRPHLERDVNESIDRIERMMKMVNQYAEVVRNKKHPVEVWSEDKDTT